MEATTLKLYSLEYKDVKTYIYASLFVIGNIVLPQLCHLIPGGGLALLPIYFFTLIGAYKYGWKVGALTAVLSPTINYLLFGMPMINMLPIIIMKSLLLAAAAGVAAKYFKRVSIPILILVVLSYQLVGTLVEWMIVGNLNIVVESFKVGIWGMLLQIFGGYLFISTLLRR